MVSLKYLGGIVLGAYVLLNSNAALSKDITDVTSGIKQCYDGPVKGWTENTKNKNRDRCAKAVIADYADKEGNKDGFATPDEIKPVVLRLEKILIDDLKNKVRKLYPMDLERKITPEPTVTEEKPLPNDKETLDKKI